MANWIPEHNYKLSMGFACEKNSDYAVFYLN